MRTSKTTNAFWGARAAQAAEASELTTHPLVKQVLAKVAAASAAIAGQSAPRPAKGQDESA